ncbi:unnamed protein product [Caenorhabditis nigoni]
MSILLRSSSSPFLAAFVLLRTKDVTDVFFSDAVVVAEAIEKNRRRPKKKKKAWRRAPSRRGIFYPAHSAEYVSILFIQLIFMTYKTK